MADREEHWKDFGGWLAAERTKAGVSQKLAAHKAGISPIQLNRIEKGHSGVKRQTIYDIIQAINENSETGYQVDMEAAHNIAGFFFGTGARSKPQNLIEFLERLREMDFEIQFDFEDAAGMGPEALQELLDAIESNLLVQRRRKQRKEA